MRPVRSLDLFHKKKKIVIFLYTRRESFYCKACYDQKFALNCAQFGLHVQNSSYVKTNLQSTQGDSGFQRKKFKIAYH